MLWLLAACSAPPAPAPTPLAPPDDAPPTARIETWRAMAADLAAPRHPSDGGGRAWLVDGPNPIHVQEWGSWTVGFEVGPEGIAVGGRIAFQSPPFWGWTPAQTQSPDGPGFTSATTDADGVTLDPETLEQGLVTFRVGGRALRPGEQIRIGYGGAAGAQADRFAERGSAMWVAVDGDGDGVREVVPTPVGVDVLAGPPVGWMATFPSVARPGKPIRLTVAALDAEGNAFAPWTGAVTVERADGLSGPDRFDVKPGDDGLASVEFSASAPGIYQVALSSADGLTGRSNSVVVRDEAEPVLWADLQVHTALSDGTGALDDVYRYARDVAALDAVAITDHDHWGMQFLDRHPEEWDAVVAAARRWTVPGRFVALPAFEWTNWIHGHRHVVWFGGEPKIYSSLDPATDTPTELWAALRGQPVLTFAHHSAGGPVATNWAFAPDPELEPVTEIASVHGQSESPSAPMPIYDAVPGNYVFDQLVSRRYTLGFIGSTDGHDGHPGLAQLAGGRGGLAALLTDDLTPDGLYRALRERRVYATNGPRILLRFDVDGHAMGQVVPLPDHPVEATARVVGTAAIDRIELVGPAGTSQRWQGDGGLVAHAAFPLAQPADGDFTYVRVIQEDGGVAWSSPIWFRADADR